MNVQSALFIGLALFAGVALASQRPAAGGTYPADAPDAPLDPGAWLDSIAGDWGPSPELGDWTPLAILDDAEAFVSRLTETPATVTPDVAWSNIGAFLAALRAAEGTDREPDPYRVVMGYGHTIRDQSDHPYFTGEWQGAYFGNPPQLSTAAGAYQFLRRTWSELRDSLGLPDFGPASQDAAALELIRRKGALEDVKAGRFAEAVSKVCRIWASLPGAGYDGQTERSLDWLAQVYATNGGQLA